jgi:hypothetical protein
MLRCVRIVNPESAIIEMLLDGRATTVAQAEEMYLNEHLEDVLNLVRSPLPEREFREHPLIRLLLAHGGRASEDCLA